MADREDIITPVGTLKYVFFNEPRDFEDDGRFKYDCKFVLRGADSEALKSSIDAVCRDGIGKSATSLKHAVWKDVEEDGDEYTEFTFKVNAMGTSKGGKPYSRKPIFLQADGTPFGMEEPQVGAGTRARIALTPYCWSTKKGDKPTGLTLQPRAVKIIELVERKVRDAGHYASAFEAEEGATGGNGAVAPKAADF